MNIQSGEPCEIWEKDSYGNPKFRVPNPKRQTYPSHEYYFKSPQQMARLFADVPEAISKQLLILPKNAMLKLILKQNIILFISLQLLKEKAYTKEEQAKAVEKFLWQLCEEGIPKRYTPERLAKVQEIYPDQDPMQVIRERLEYEMNIIVPKGNE